MLLKEVQELAAMEMHEQKKARIGFLGVGWIGKHRLEAIRNSNVADIVALCDPLAPDTDRFCKDNNLKKINSYEDLLEEDIEGVVIATPNALHKEQVILALKKGKSVLCQKPLASTASDMQEVFSAARENNCLLMADLSYRYTSALKKLRAAIEGGEIGHVYAAHLTFHNAAGPDRPWYYDTRLAGRGCVMDLGVHLIDILYWIFPDLTIDRICSNLFAEGKPLNKSDKKLEDYAMIHINYQQDITTQLCCSWNLSAGIDASLELRFYGTKGGATFSNVNGSFYDFKSELYKGSKRHVLSLPPDDWGGKAAVHWASLLNNKNEYLDDVDNYIKTAETLDHIYGLLI